MMGAMPPPLALTKAAVTRAAVTIVAVVLAAGCTFYRAPTAAPGEVYEQVLRRYLTMPKENSFPENVSKAVYVLDRAYANAGRPGSGPKDGVAIPVDAQDRIVHGLASLTAVKFIADKESVLDHSNGCDQVKDGGILVTLGTFDGDDREAKVGVYGFVACRGATWLTYVVEKSSGTGWTVKGTTGPKGTA